MSYFLFLVSYAGHLQMNIELSSSGTPQVHASPKLWATTMDNLHDFLHAEMPYT